MTTKFSPDVKPRPRMALPQDEGEVEPTWRDELEAVRVCLDALVPLPPETQQRILAAVICILDGQSAVQVLREWKATRGKR